MALTEVKNPVQKVIDEKDVSEAVFTGNSFNVNAQDTDPTDVHISLDGSKMYMVGLASDSIHEYDLPNAGSLIGAVFTGNSFSVSAQDLVPTGVHLSPDGSKMYIIGLNSDFIHEYDLPNAGSLIGAVFTGNSLNVNAQDAVPTGVHLSLDGSIMYMVGLGTNSVYEYDLPNAGSLIGAVFTGNSFSVSAQDTDTRGVHISPDGSKMYTVGLQTDSIYEYDLPNAGSLIGAVFTGNSFSVGSEDLNPTGVHLSLDGSKMYMIGLTSDSIHEYDVSDVSLFNCFKGYVPTFFELRREDIQINSITSQLVGADEFAKITFDGTLDADQNIVVGDTVTFSTPLYPNKSGVITSVLGSPIFQIVVDVPFIGSDGNFTVDDIHFLNYRKNWFTQYRIVDAQSETDAQTSVNNLFDFFFTSQSEISGKVELDISVANNKNKPSTEIGLPNQDLFLFFKIQWREIYLDNINDWVSPSLFGIGDLPMIVFHASDQNKQENGIEIPFQNNLMIEDPILTRFWGDALPKINFLRSRLSDTVGDTSAISVQQFDIRKNQIQSDEISINNIDGIHVVDLSTISLNALTVFVIVGNEIVIDTGQYESTQYELTQYET